MFPANGKGIGTEKVDCTILPPHKYIASTLVRHGMIPCSLISPSMAVTVDALELYRISHLRCPHLSIQAFVKTLSDLHGVRSSLSLIPYFTDTGGRLNFIDIYPTNFPSRLTYIFRSLQTSTTLSLKPPTAMDWIGIRNTYVLRAPTN